MRKLIIPSAVVSIFALCCVTIGTVQGQQGGGRSTAPLPHKVGLIDMAHVFKEYDKFKAFRENIKAEIDRSQQRAEDMRQSLANLQQEMKMLKEGSPEYTAKEKEFIRLKADFDSYRAQAQRDFLKQESELYKTIYLEVTDVVRMYAEAKNYTLILRFSRTGVNEAEDPQSVLTSMNRQIVYYQKNDDITEPILQYLNGQYRKTAGGGSRTRTK